MGRSIKKGPFVELYLLEKITKLNATGLQRSPSRMWSRRSMITPEFVGQYRSMLYNGKVFELRCSSLKNMVGHRLGEFSLDPHV